MNAIFYDQQQQKEHESEIKEQLKSYETIVNYAQTQSWATTHEIKATLNFAKKHHFDSLVDKCKNDSDIIRLDKVTNEMNQAIVQEKKFGCNYK